MNRHNWHEIGRHEVSTFELERGAYALAHIFGLVTGIVLMTAAVLLVELDVSLGWRIAVYIVLGGVCSELGERAWRWRRRAWSNRGARHD